MAAQWLQGNPCGCNKCKGASGNGLGQPHGPFCRWLVLLRLRAGLPAGEGWLMLVSLYIGGLVACYFGGYKAGIVVKFINQLGNGA